MIEISLSTGPTFALFIFHSDRLQSAWNQTREELVKVVRIDASAGEYHHSSAVLEECLQWRCHTGGHDIDVGENDRLDAFQVLSDGVLRLNFTHLKRRSWNAQRFLKEQPIILSRHAARSAVDQQHLHAR